ncbi:MAG: cytosine permease [Thermoplasmatales archaeon]|nr:cytosine permease [Candidatus Thermoplasmatota archaeon]MCL6003087.1 cytosine permease [Candidatus Thermoplasmatota archaeon]MDA8054394.1 cytosine permease [Thermoplasmatales archaeon]
MTLENVGIQRIPTESRQGKPRSLFNLWFAANLTIADFALGFIPISLGMNFVSSIISIVIGNILGAAIVGLSAVMGPKTGYPQMMSTTNSMGRLVMRLFGIINLSNTLGWFIVNNILSVLALYLIFGMSYFILIPLFVLAVYIVAYLGHNFIHKVERILSYVLGVLFVIILVKILFFGSPQSLSTFEGLSIASARIDISFFGMIAFSYSYLMSWGPYASDYSRYLPMNVSLKKVFSNTFLGSFLSTTFVEIIALIISFVTLSTSSISSLKSISGSLYPLSLFAIALGGIAANVLNLYSASLSGLVGGIKLNRTKFVGLVAIVGLVLSLLFYRGFYSFFESFLLVLDYWISPWVAILVIDFLVLKKQRLNFDRKLRLNGIISYCVGLLVSVPFMNIFLGNFNYTFVVSKALGGIDISYFVGFIVAAAVYYMTSLNRDQPVQSVRTGKTGV